MESPSPAAGAPAVDRSPWRVVDRLGWGWYRQASGAYRRDHPSVGRYWPDYGADCTTQPAPRTYAGLVADGLEPRPVLAAPDGDLEALRGALAAAGRAACLSVFAGLLDVVRRVAAECGTDGRQHPLIGGRGGSHEAETLCTVLALVDRLGPEQVGAIDGGARALVAEVVYRWVSGAAGYVEVADSVSVVLAGAADAAGGGLESIADEGLCSVPGMWDALEWYALKYSASPPQV